MKTATAPFTFALFLCLMAAGCANRHEPVTTGSLVREMVNPSLLSEYPDPYFTCRQFSSYDRRTVSPDQDGWFANHDASWFVREETNAGRREFVMLDAEGPGAVVRFWMTFGNEQAYTGTLRFYLDGNQEPAIEGPVLDLISGGKLAGAPLSSSVSPLTPNGQRGHNLYLPIPYSRQLKITYECPALNPEKHSPSVYYNINYRTWEKGAEVRSFSMQDLVEFEADIKSVNEKLASCSADGRSLPSLVESGQPGGTVIEPGKNVVNELRGPGAIYTLSLKIKAEAKEQALRSTVLKITFDGENTVWCPVGDFFGTGYQIRPSSTWYTSVTEDGTLSANWVMPYRKTAVVEIINYGEQPVELEHWSVGTGKYKWTRSSMHFGAIWHEFNGIDAKGYLGDHIKGKHEDINFVTLQGSGLYAGDAMTIFNTADAWWGEGDEKVYVDGEAFPSHIGTGTEDYIGYAWCRPEVFSHFLIAQPDGSGNFHPGMTINMRRRMLDAVPFTSGIRFDMELWHWATTRMNYAVVSYWYLKPQGKCNVVPDENTVKLPVSLKRESLYPPVPDLAGYLQGEHLRVVSTSGGSWEVQGSSAWGWSNNQQLWWMDGGVGGLLKAEFELAQEGTYSVSLNFTKAVDYGNFRIMINDQPVSGVFKGFSKLEDKPVVTEFRELGKFNLKQGINTVQLEVTGKDPSAIGRYMVGIDYLKIRND